MRSYTKLAMAMLIAALAVSFGAGTANALRSLSIVGETTLTLNGLVKFEGRGSVEIECNVTMVKTVSRVIPKVEGTLMGRVTDVRVAFGEPRCRSSAGTLQDIRILGTAAVDLWRLFYKTFLGSLPNPSGYKIQIARLQTLFLVSGLSCLYEGTVEGLARVDASGNIERLNAVLPNSIPLSSGSFLCGRAGQFVTPNGLTPLQTISIRLI